MIVDSNTISFNNPLMSENDLQNKVCLIGGTGRSGTTVLKRVFSRHPNATNIPEGRFTIDPDGLADFYSAMSSIWSPYLFHVKIKRLKKILYATGRNRFLLRAYTYALRKTHLEDRMPLRVVPAYSGVGVERNCPNFIKYADELIEKLTEFSYRGHWNGSSLFESPVISYASDRSELELAQILGAFWRDVITETCRHQGVEFYVEDNTWNILWFDVLRKFIPDAKLVHIYRDPRDVVASYMQRIWAPNDAYQAACWYRGIINRWFDIRNGIDDNDYMEIKLEELAAQPQQKLQEVCEFWGMPWDDALLQTKLDRVHSGRWKKDLSSEQAKIINSELESEIIKLGYAL